MKRQLRCAVIFASMALSSASASEAVPTSSLRAHTHVHGLAIDRTEPAYILIATHHGIYRADLQGRASLISPVQDFMGFSAHPSAPDTLMASGHPPSGGNLGFIVSDDGGKNWVKRSDGVGGPVDFHQLTVSPANPSVLYGVFRGLQLSRDAGTTWSLVGPPPEKIIDLAGSATDDKTLYAATQAGLMLSKDAGKSWTALLGSVATMVSVEGDRVYAFLPGTGLVSAKESDLRFDTISPAPPDFVILHLAVDLNANSMFAATAEGQVLKSADGGKTWDEL